MLGLAPSTYLRQTSAKSLLDQLLHNRVVERPIFSLMLINGHEGVLSIGGTGAKAVEMVNKHTADELERAGAKTEMEVFLEENGRTRQDGTNTLDVTKNSKEKINLHKRNSESEGANTRQGFLEEGWTWSDVQGAEGWWQTLMPGVWVDGSRVLQNQAVVVDVRTVHLLVTNGSFSDHGTD